MPENNDILKNKIEEIFEEHSDSDVMQEFMNVIFKDFPSKSEMEKLLERD